MANDLNGSTAYNQYTDAPPELVLPPKFLLDGYTTPFTGFYETQTRTQAVGLPHDRRLDSGADLIIHPNKTRPRSSALLNINDPVAIHLLVETALGDSEQFEVLSFEELDDLKKESSYLSKRIEATQRKLMLESKVRDAATSLSRLSSKRGKTDDTNTPFLRRQNITLGRYGSKKGPSRELEDDLATSNRSCEGLAQDLWKLEKRLISVQGRILQHTAGVLQMTHRDAETSTGDHQDIQTQVLPPNDISNTHLQPSVVGNQLLSQHSSINGSPYLGLAKQATPGEQEPVKQLQSLDYDQSSRVIRNIEQKLQKLNSQLRDVISDVNPSKTTAEKHPFLHEPLPQQAAASDVLDDHARAQLEYLSKGLDVLRSEHERAIHQFQVSDNSVEDSVRRMNSELHQIIVNRSLQDDQYHQTPPELGGGKEEQLDGLREQLEVIKRVLQPNVRNPARQERAEQYETVVTGLWEIIMSGEPDASRHSRQGLSASLDQRADGKDNLIDGEDGPLEQFSLQAFSAKVQWLYNRVTALDVEKNILRRQIQQQRELSQDSETAKDSVVRQLKEELEGKTTELEMADKDTSNARQEMAAVMQRLDAARKELTMREQQRANDDSSVMNELAMKQQEISRLEALIQGSQDNQDRIQAETKHQISENEDRIQALEVEYQNLAQDKERLATSEAVLKQQIRDMTQQLESSQADLKKLEDKVVQLQAEATFARAELDAAHGTRAQRAAETAPDTSLQNEMDELARRNMSLLEEVALLKRNKPEVGSSSINNRDAQRHLELQNEMEAVGQRNMSLLEEISSLKRERSYEESSSASTKDLQNRIEMLQQELSETIDEYEAMTRQSVEFEKDREQLESVIDKLRERCETVEGQLNEEKIKWMGFNNIPIAGGPGGGGGGKEGGPMESTSTMVLRKEFKKMVRDMKAENVKVLRVSCHSARICFASQGCGEMMLMLDGNQAEQEERRKLEALIRAMKKEQSGSVRRDIAQSTSPL